MTATLLQAAQIVCLDDDDMIFQPGMWWWRTAVSNTLATPRHRSR